MHFNGLTDKQVEESRKKYGSNVIPDSEPTTFWAEFKETFKDPMIRILLAIAALMLIMCVAGYAEIYEPGHHCGGADRGLRLRQDRRGQRHQVPPAEGQHQEGPVARSTANGLVTVIDVDDVVVGDKVLLQSGDKVPADGVLIHGSLKVEQLRSQRRGGGVPQDGGGRDLPAAGRHHRRHLRGRSLPVPGRRAV